MQISIKTPSGVIPVEFKSQAVKLTSPLALLEIRLGKNESCDICEGKNIHCCQAGENHYKLNVSVKNIITVGLKTPDTLVNLQISCTGGNAIDKKTIENLIHFSNSLKMLPSDASGQIPINSLLAAIEANEITLLSVQKPLTGYDNQSLLSQIQSALTQKVRAICSSPKQGMRTEEVVQDVSLVKRINTDTLSHLASHSEHWKVRTLNGLVPKRLKADIIEDEINIYENLFFRMAVDDVAEYSTQQILSLKAAKRQNTDAIDWESYGAKVNDYRRSLLLQKVLSGRDISELSRENKVFDDALQMWLQVSKILTSIRGSAFYRKIDSKKRIGRTIHLTNILKNDQRYKALYDIWCLVQKEKQKEQQEKQGINNDIINAAECYYTAYCIIALIYAMNLLGIEFLDGSTFSVGQFGQMTIQATAEDDYFRYSLYNKEDQYGFTYLNLQLEEKVDIAISVPAECDFSDVVFSHIKSVASYDAEENCIHLHKKPNSAERTALRELLHKPQYEIRKLSTQDKFKYQKSTYAWNEFVVDLISDARLHDPQIRTLKISPMLFHVQAEATAVDNFTQDLFDSANEYSCYLLPHSLEDYRDIKNVSLLRRLFNYGEAYHLNDEDGWKDYHVAVLPTTQTDLGTIQRLMKFVSLHRSKMIIDIEDSNAIHCPICGKTHIKALDANSWKCEDPECGIEWGKTRCTKGCKQYFYWIRPDCNVNTNDFYQLPECENILKKDSLFDRYIITDFEFEEQIDGSLTLYPVCPKCGARRFP